ncbi:MAG TPA: YceH family protein [Acidobacteriaceae bacterium]|nr:YceH family protein [Acidobacteriaceae bacterium]
MPTHLSPVEVRVLGSLIEKEATTPEYYPLSLNALVNACNQKNNREPVLQLTEDEVRPALHRLQDQGLAAAVHDSRVTKYEHHLQEVFNLTRGETGVLCVLLLRGAQTPGELRGRTERMHRFEEAGDVLAVLDKLAQRDPALIMALPRQPGSRELRYAHLLSGQPDLAALASGAVEAAASTGTSPEADRLAQLEAEVAALREQIAELREQIAALSIERS